MAVALYEIHLLPTKQLIFSVLQENPRNCESLKPFSDKDLAYLYENSFDFDGNLICLALDSSDQLNQLTEALTLLFMVQDFNLKNVALVHFLRENDLMDMLLDSHFTYTLNFEINKDISLRTFLQQADFIELILTAVDLVKESDRIQCVCLLDKIFERRKSLQMLIEIQLSRIQRTKPLTFVTDSKELRQINRNQVEFASDERVRVLDQFRAMLENYRKEGAEE